MVARSLLEMHQIIYVSRATVPLDQSQLDCLLTQARRFNAKHQVTGILLYGHEQFLQVLEGEARTVQALYASIRRDPRHCQVTTYTDQPIGKRAFADWQMAYQALPPQQFLRYASYLLPSEVNLSRKALSAAEQQTLQLLRAFLFLEEA